MKAEGGDIDLRSISIAALWYDGVGLEPAHSAVGDLFLFEEWMGEELPVAIIPEGLCERDNVAYCMELPPGTLTIPAGETMQLSVRIDASSDADGGSNRTPLFLMIPADGIEAADALTGLPLPQNDGHLPARGEVIVFPKDSLVRHDRKNIPLYGTAEYPVFSKILSLENVTPAAPSTLGSGPLSLASLKVTAAEHRNEANGLNAVTLRGLLFNVTAQNVSLNPSSLSLGSSPCVAITDDGEAITTALSGSFLVSCPLSLPIAQDTAETLTLTGTVFSPRVDPSKTSLLVVSLQRFAQRSYRSFSPASSHLLWEDKDGAGGVPYLWTEHRTGIIEFLRYVKE